MDNNQPLAEDSAEDLAAFEDRLRAIRPAAPSASLKPRLGQSLQPRPWFTQPGVLGLAGLAAAACLTLVVWFWPTAAVDDLPREDIASRLPGPIEEIEQPAVAEPAARLTLLSYRRALRDDPASLDALFDAQAAPSHYQFTAPPRPLTAMDAKMFLYEDERCDG